MMFQKWIAGSTDYDIIEFIRKIIESQVHSRENSFCRLCSLIYLFIGNNMIQIEFEAYI